MIKCHLSIWIRHMIRVSLNLHCRHVIVLFLDDRGKVFVLWLLSSGRNPNCWRKCCWRKVVEWLDIFTANITQFSLQILGKFALWPFKLIQIGQIICTCNVFSEFCKVHENSNRSISVIYASLQKGSDSYESTELCCITYSRLFTSFKIYFTLS